MLSRKASVNESARNSCCTTRSAYVLGRAVALHLCVVWKEGCERRNKMGSVFAVVRHAEESVTGTGLDFAFPWQGGLAAESEISVWNLRGAWSFLWVLHQD